MYIRFLSIRVDLDLDSVKMKYSPLTEGDKATIENCFKEKGWSGRRIVKEFPNKRWSRSTVCRLIAKIKNTGTVVRKTGSGRPKTAISDDNIERVEELVQSQEEPGTHKSLREAASDLNVSKSSVQRMVKKLKLKPFRRIRVSRRDENVRIKRKTRCQNLDRRYSTTDVNRIVFTDKKDFTLETAKIHRTTVFMEERKVILVHLAYIIKQVEFFKEDNDTV